MGSWGPSYPYRRIIDLTFGGFQCFALPGSRHVLVDSGCVAAAVLILWRAVFLGYFWVGKHLRAGQSYWLRPY